jgi:hypothetical protein
LGYVATMLEAGVPVVFFYIEDMHDNQIKFPGASRTFGPGEAGFEVQLQQATRRSLSSSPGSRRTA